MPSGDQRIGYVLKMYPRISETFILNEILAHEAAGLDLIIFSLRPPVDGRFHADLARVKAPVVYLRSDRLKAEDFWQALRRESAQRPDQLRLERLADRESAQDLHQAIQLANLVHEHGVTHLHAHFASVATTVTRLAARLADVPYSFTAHAKDIFHESVEDEDLSRKLRDAAAVVTVSDFNVQHLRDRFADAAERVHRIYNGLDLDDFPYRSPVDRARVVVGAGRLVQKKGFGDLVDACARLKAKGCDFRCELVGDGLVRSSLEKQIDESGVRDRITLAGAQPRWKVVERVQQGAVLAAPCVVGDDGNRDGLPTVIIEAMALGTPVVSTPVTGIPEIVRHEETGLIVPERDPEALAAAIERLLDDEVLRVRLATNARKLVEEEYDIHRNTAKARNLIVSVSVPPERMPAEVG